VSGLSVLFIGCLSATATGAAAVVAITGAAAFCCLAYAFSCLQIRPSSYIDPSGIFRRKAASVGPHRTLNSTGSRDVAAEL